MPKKLAVGARKAAMKGKKSASKRELIEAGEETPPPFVAVDRKKTKKSRA